MSPPRRTLAATWARHDAEWRDGAQVASQWEGAAAHDPRLFHVRAKGAFWDALAASDITLLVTREYEHLVMALRADGRGGKVTYFPLPHPSGLVVDRTHRRVHVASTRNPNQVFEFAPVSGDRQGSRTGADERPLVPVRTRVYPGSLYLHDLARVGGDLVGNAVGENAIVRLDETTDPPRVWWPRCIETRQGPVFDTNHLQLNSIAAGPDLARSFFSASTDVMSRRRPGHRNFPVDGRGVIFSGATREPIVRGLTRPHSARLHRRTLWVANSGYGELGTVAGGRFEPVVRLPGWTRGLCLHGQIAFVGTSRVLPRFHAYAPGVDPASAVCGIHAIDLRSGKALGSLTWPAGNQLFAIDWMPSRMSTGFPFEPGRRAGPRERRLFSGFTAA